MTTSEKVRCCFSSIIFLLVLGALAVVSPQFSGAEQADSVRRLVQRTAAPYPALARSMALQGIVKIEVLVSPDGSVKDAQIKGGHPVLAQAAVNAVRHWKWEPAAHESHEVVEVKFSPE